MTYGIIRECRWEQPAHSKQKGQLQRRITEHTRNTNIGDKSRYETERYSGQDFTTQWHKAEFIHTHTQTKK
jgi:hypothetical protein